MPVTPGAAAEHAATPGNHQDGAPEPTDTPELTAAPDTGDPAELTLGQRAATRTTATRDDIGQATATHDHAAGAATTNPDAIPDNTADHPARTAR